eukprot:455433-Pelagomonas_calceolata.AAC.2
MLATPSLPCPPPPPASPLFRPSAAAVAAVGRGWRWCFTGGVCGLGWLMMELLLLLLWMGAFEGRELGSWLVLGGCVAPAAATSAAVSPAAV